MNTYVTGSTIRQLREAKGLTQAELAGTLSVSAKTISKWETAKGLARYLPAGTAGCGSGGQRAGADAGRTHHQPEPGSQPAAEQALRLPSLRQCAPRHRTGCGELLRHRPACAGHRRSRGCRRASSVDCGAGGGRALRHPAPPMEKNHYISFLAYLTGDKLQLVKLYPEGDASARFSLRGAGVLYFYCNCHGLMKAPDFRTATRHTSPRRSTCGSRMRATGNR